MSNAAPADYKALAPYGFEGVGDLTINLQTVLECIRDLKSNSFVVAAADGSASPSESPFALLNSASTSVNTLSAVPVSAFRSASAYARVLMTLAPNASDLDAFCSAVLAAAEAIPKIDHDAASEAAKSAQSDVSSASEAISSASASVKRIKVAIAGMLIGKPPSPNPLDGVSFLSVVAGCFKPITGDLDITKPGPQAKLLSLAGLTISPSNILKPFGDIMTSDKAEAQRIQVSWNSCATKLNSATSLFGQANFAADTYMRALSGVQSGLSSLPAGIARFKRSFDSPPENWEQGNKDTVALWDVINQNLQGYITLATQGLSATMGFLSAKSMSLRMHSEGGKDGVVSLKSNGRSDDKSPEDVRDAFGPPSYLETLLADLGPESGRVNKALSDFLAIPYVNAFKVTTKQGEESDLRSVVLDVRAKYLALQTKSLPIIREINAYALVSQALLPKVNQTGGIPLEDFLEQATLLVMRHGEKAKGIAEETRALQQEFQDIMDQLQQQLVQVVNQIEEQKEALSQAEREYRFAWITAVLEGILTLAYAAGAINSLMSGLTPAAGQLALKGSLALTETIKATLKAVGLAHIIENLKASIARSQESKRQLETLIPMFGSMLAMMTKIGDAWDMISGNLGDVEIMYELWANPKFFTPSNLELTLDSWNNVRAGVQQYVDVIVGISFSDSDIKPGTMSFLASESPPAYTNGNGTGQAAEPLSAEDFKLGLKVLMAMSGRDEVNAYFSAPTMSGHPPSPEELDSMVRQWADVAQTLSGAGEAALVGQVRALSSSLSSVGIPRCRDAVRSLLDFAKAQPQVPTLPVSEAEWQKFHASRVSRLAQGRDTSALVDAALRDLQTQARNTLDFTRARCAELEQQEGELVHRIEQLRRDLDYQQRRLAVILSGIGVIIGGPVVQAIKIIIEAITHDIRDANQEQARLWEQISATRSAATVVGTSQDRLSSIWSMSASIALFWADMATQANTAADLWVILEPMRELEVELYKTTWSAVVSSFGAWEGKV